MRDRSLALAVRDGRILMLRTCRWGRTIFELPGGGIEPGETPAQAALRELREETGLTGTILRPLNVLHRPNGATEHVFLVEPGPEEPAAGTDPELGSGEEQVIRAAGWMAFDELSEKDRAFLWSYGLMDVPGFFEQALSWGDAVSWPGRPDK